MVGVEGGGRVVDGVHDEQSCRHEPAGPVGRCDGVRQERAADALSAQ